jgi:hypothetical protein
MRIALPLGPTAGLSPSFGLTSSRVDTGAVATRATYGLGADWRDPGRRWNASASVNRTQVGRTLALTSRASIKFNLTSVDAVTLVVRSNRYRSLVDPAQDFNERALNLQWGRRF